MYDLQNYSQQQTIFIGGLNVLQLMSEPMAVALNYGMFRRKEINGTAKNLILYDMGAQVKIGRCN